MKFYDEVVTDKMNIHRFSWLIAVTGLDSASRYDLLKNLAEMYDKGEDIRTVTQDSYEAIMYRGKNVGLGFLRGIEFSATVETEAGKQDLSLIVLN